HKALPDTGAMTSRIVMSRHPGRARNMAHRDMARAVSHPAGKSPETLPRKDTDHRATARAEGRADTVPAEADRRAMGPADSAALRRRWASRDREHKAMAAKDLAGGSSPEVRSSGTIRHR